MRADANSAERPTIRGPRSRPLYFAGRRDELSRLDRRLKLFRAGDESAADDGIELVVGVPGSGKSALLERFAERSDVTAVRVEAFGLDNAKSVFLSVGEAAGLTEQAHAIIGLKPRVTGVQGGMRFPGAAGVTGGVQFDHGRESDIAVDRTFSKLGEAWADRPPVAVLVDELQNVSSEGAATLQALHAGRHGCPIMLVGAGLQHTTDALRKIGISRPKPPMTVHCLDADDAADAVVQNLGKIGRNITQRAIDAIVSASHGFPVHLQGYLEAVERFVPEDGWVGDGDTLRDVLREGGRGRTHYYEERLDHMRGDVINPRKAMCIVVAGLRGADESLPIDEAHELFKDTPFDGHAVVDSAIRHGVLRHVRDRVDFGIPSFHDHMAGILARERREHQSLCR